MSTALRTIASKDGTPIAIECSGSGPHLLMVHGGLGDRRRWTPLFPHLSRGLTACAMDRRGHGDSGDTGEHSLEKEIEDVVAVIESLPGPVYVLGHSWGGVAVYEAAFRTRVAKLVLYEPALESDFDLSAADRIDEWLGAGDPEKALETFFRDVSQRSEEDIAAMKKGPRWTDNMTAVRRVPRQMRAIGPYRFDRERARTLDAPTLLLTGETTQSVALKQTVATLHECLPKSSLVVLEGHGHNAMETGRETLAAAIDAFLVTHAS